MNASRAKNLFLKQVTNYPSVIGALTHLPGNSELVGSSAFGADSGRVTERHGGRCATDGDRELTWLAPAELVACSHVKDVLGAWHQSHPYQQPRAADARHSPVGSRRASWARVRLAAEERHVVEDGVLEDGVVVWNCWAPCDLSNGRSTAHHPDASRSVWSVCRIPTYNSATVLSYNMALTF